MAPLLLLLLSAAAFFLLRRFFLNRRSAACYILDYVCLRPPDALKITTDAAVDVVVRNDQLKLNDFKFLHRIMTASGLGDSTYATPNVIDGREASGTHRDSMDEMAITFYPLLDDLFRRTAVSPSSVDAVIVNVSLFTPVPSLAAMIVNRYKMRDDVVTYNLSGMGCSASIPAMKIARDLFASRRKNSLALVVSGESIAQNWYSGLDRAMMVGNCLFRVGSTAILLTNSPSLRRAAKFKLRYVVRTHAAAVDDAYRCAFQMEDASGTKGIRLTKNIINVAGETLTKNLRTLAPQILPLSELLRYAVTKATEAKAATVDLTAGVDHFAIHSGGKAVIDAVGKALRLSDYHLEPSRMTLHRWGNTSASTLWYSLAYMEAKGRLKKGDRVLMIGLGAGFQANSCVLEVARHGVGDRGAWEDTIDEYPALGQVNPFADKYKWLHGDDADVKTMEFLSKTNRAVDHARLFAGGEA